MANNRVLPDQPPTRDDPLASLFEPFSLGSLELRNRIVMAPMSRFFSPDGLPGADVAAYYRRRAKNGCGLIITEGTTVNSPAAGGYKGVPVFHGEALSGWKHIVDEVHAVGGKIWPQLWHVGMQRDPAIVPDPETPARTPSGFDPGFKRIGVPMTLAEVNGVIAAFVTAARDAKMLGFDGVQIHGAHGYLVDQFFWQRTNDRADGYGGSIRARARFASELISAIRAEVGDYFPISLRISQWKLGNYDERMAPDPEHLTALLEPVTVAGVDVLDCSQRRFWVPEFPGSDWNLAGWVKHLTGVPTITVGSVGLESDLTTDEAGAVVQAQNNLSQLAARLARGEFDLVGVGRGLISNPDWALDVESGRGANLKAYDSALLKSLT